MSELYIKPLQDYLKQLCVEHVLLLHDDTTNVVFIRFQTEEDTASIPVNAAKYFVIVNRVLGQAKGDFDENKIRQENTILFLRQAKSHIGKDIEDAQEKAMELMFDFYVRMKQDYYDDTCGPLRYLQPEQMTFEPVDGPVEENHFGWLMTIPLDVNLPGYDPSKWNR